MSYFEALENEFHDSEQEILAEHRKGRKRGRKGYVIFVEKASLGWVWAIETQNGVAVAQSVGFFTRKADLFRSLEKLLSAGDYEVREDV